MWHKTNMWHDVTQKELYVTQIEIYVTGTSQIRHFVSHKFFFVSRRVTHIFFLSHCVTHIFLIRFFWDVWHDVTQQNRGSSYYAYINFCFFCVTFFHISIFFFLIVCLFLRVTRYDTTRMSLLYFDTLFFQYVYFHMCDTTRPSLLYYTYRVWCRSVSHVFFFSCVSFPMCVTMWHFKTEPPALRIFRFVSQGFTRFFFSCVSLHMCDTYEILCHNMCDTTRPSLLRNRMYYALREIGGWGRVPFNEPYAPS